MKKQTSIEWFAIQVYEQMNMQGDGVLLDELFGQAKAMHKQEIIAAADANYTYDEDIYGIGTIGENYYKKTFKP